MWERRVPTRRALNRRAAGPAACPIQSWLRDTAAVVSKAAQQQVGLISGQAGKTGWGCEGCVRAVGNGNKGEKMHDAYAHNLDELDDGKEEGNDRGKIDTGGGAEGEGHGGRWWSTVVDRKFMAFRAVVTCFSLDFAVRLLQKKSCR